MAVFFQSKLGSSLSVLSDYVSDSFPSTSCFYLPLNISCEKKNEIARKIISKETRKKAKKSRVFLNVIQNNKRHTTIKTCFFFRNAKNFIKNFENRNEEDDNIISFSENDRLSKHKNISNKENHSRQNKRDFFRSISQHLCNQEFVNCKHSAIKAKNMVESNTADSRSSDLLNEITFKYYYSDYPEWLIKLSSCENKTGNFFDFVRLKKTAALAKIRTSPECQNTKLNVEELYFQQKQKLRGNKSNEFLQKLEEKKKRKTENKNDKINLKTNRFSSNSGNEEFNQLKDLTNEISVYNLEKAEYDNEDRKNHVAILRSQFEKGQTDWFVRQLCEYRKYGNMY